jgi:rhodanese-related sulfurtransferase
MTKSDDVTSGSAQLLDVRTLEEWQEGHAEGALHIPLDELLQGRGDQLDPSKKVYIYCRTGGRAGMATSYLQKNGSQAENIGGLSDWVRAGGTLAKS